MKRCERERQRHEWRARVDAAVKERDAAKREFHRIGPSHEARPARMECRARIAAAWAALDAALAAPKPWRER